MIIMLEFVASFLLLFSLIKEPAIAVANFVQTKEHPPLASREISLETRYADSFVNGVFRDNILLAVKYTAEGKIDPKQIDWNEVNKPFEQRIVLKPGQTFAFHDDVLPEYEGKIAKTSNTHFNAAEGYKFSGALWGDGVCHLASLLYWVAKDAGVKAVAPVRHDFAHIPEVPREYGVSIYATPGENASDKAQNLYITNTRENEIAFVFEYDGGNLKISANELL